MGTDDDDGLKSLRAVWLSMPDEDPPERGLAELMAAARVKANEMAAAQPSLWERFVAMMRRPQVLALATIMILIGGAVFITQRRDEMAATSETGATPSQTVVTPGEGSASLERELSKQEPVSDKTGDVAAQPEANEEMPADMGKADAPATAAAKPERKAAVPKKAPKASKSKVGKSADWDNDALLLDAEGGTSSGKLGAGGGGGVVGGTATGASQGRGGNSTATTTSTPPADPPAQQPTVKELHAQARAAAVKGDCAAVRRIAKQIAARDAAFYRENIAPDQALATCLK